MDVSVTADQLSLKLTADWLHNNVISFVFDML